MVYKHNPVSLGKVGQGMYAVFSERIIYVALTNMYRGKVDKESVQSSPMGITFRLAQCTMTKSVLLRQLVLRLESINPSAKVRFKK